MTPFSYYANRVSKYAFLPILSFNFYYFYNTIYAKMKLGIDIGGTNISLGIVNNGIITKSLQVKSFEREWNLDKTIDHLCSNIESFITDGVEGIGIGVPSVVDINRGIVYDTANIPSWKEVHLADILEERFKLPVHINNDANCYALGAYTSLDGGEKPSSLVTMTLGTGVGMGIVLDGKLFCGANCGAGELSCLPYRESTIEDHCCKNHFLRFGWTPKEAYDAAMAENETAVHLFDEFGRNLGFAVCAILYSYDPECIVIGGGITKGAPLFMPALKSFVKANFPYHKTVENLRIEIMNNDDIPVIGAASLV